MVAPLHQEHPVTRRTDRRPLPHCGAPRRSTTNRRARAEQDHLAKHQSYTLRTARNRCRSAVRIVRRKKGLPPSRPRPAHSAWAADRRRGGPAARHHRRRNSSWTLRQEQSHRRPSCAEPRGLAKPLETRQPCCRPRDADDGLLSSGTSAFSLPGPRSHRSSRKRCV